VPATGTVLTAVCLFVCLSASRMTQEVIIITRKRGKTQRVARPACANATVHFLLTLPTDHCTRNSYLSIYILRLKKHHGYFSCNLSKHYQIWIIFGLSVTWRLGNQKPIYFPTSPKHCVKTSIFQPSKIISSRYFIIVADQFRCSFINYNHIDV